jgi:hypothetical protein
MSGQSTHSPQQLVERYLALWHEPDDERRQASINALWTEDGAQFTRTQAFQGYDALDKRVTTAHEKWVQEGGFRFKLAGDVDTHHNAVKFAWEMVPRDGGDVAGSGLIFLVLSDDGRIQLDYQF